MPAAPKRSPAAPREGGFPRFYPVIDVTLCAARGLAAGALAAACLRGGARLLQVRWKDGASRDFLAVVQSVVALARPYGACVIVNDRVDIALMGGADGVHVGQEDLPAADARNLLGPAAQIGLSTHDEPQIDAALETDVDYVAVGPIHATSTKDTGYGARGADLLRHAAGRGKPIVAIGGISLENGRSVLDAGASSLAVISDLLEGGGPEARTRAFLAL